LIIGGLKFFAIFIKDLYRTMAHTIYIGDFARKSATLVVFGKLTCFFAILKIAFYHYPATLIKALIFANVTLSILRRNKIDLLNFLLFIVVVGAYLFLRKYSS